VQGLSHFPQWHLNLQHAHHPAGPHPPILLQQLQQPPPPVLAVRLQCHLLRPLQNNFLPTRLHHLKPLPSPSNNSNSTNKFPIAPDIFHNSIISSNRCLQLNNPSRIPCFSGFSLPFIQTTKRNRILPINVPLNITRRLIHHHNHPLFAKITARLNNISSRRNMAKPISRCSIKQQNRVRMTLQ